MHVVVVWVLVPVAAFVRDSSGEERPAVRSRLVANLELYVVSPRHPVAVPLDDEDRRQALLSVDQLVGAVISFAHDNWLEAVSVVRVGGVEPVEVVQELLYLRLLPAIAPLVTGNDEAQPREVLYQFLSNSVAAVLSSIQCHRLLLSLAGSRLRPILPSARQGVIAMLRVSYRHHHDYEARRDWRLRMKLDDRQKAFQGPAVGLTHGSRRGELAAYSRPHKR